MKKTHLAALGKLYIHEIDSALDKKTSTDFPFQSKAKVFAELESDGLVRRAEVRVGSGWSAVVVRGWELTHAGRFAYCATCTDEPEPGTAAQESA